MKKQSTVERTSEREVVFTRTVNGPARLVFEAWTTPALLMRWWAPRSMGLTMLACEADVRTGGTYRFTFSHEDAPKPLVFFGKYVEVKVPSLLVWTNDEGEGPGPITTVTFEEQGGKTLLTVRDLYPSKAELDAAMDTAMYSGMDEALGQLDDLLATPEA